MIPERNLHSLTVLLLILGGSACLFFGQMIVHHATLLPEINKMHLSTFNADFNQISSVLAECRQNIHGLRDSSEELIPLFLNKLVQLTV